MWHGHYLKLSCVGEDTKYRRESDLPKATELKTDQASICPQVI